MVSLPDGEKISKISLFILAQLYILRQASDSVWQGYLFVMLIYRRVYTSGEAGSKISLGGTAPATSGKCYTLRKVVNNDCARRKR